MIIRGIGVGKSIYKKAIKEFRWISTNKMNRALDAVAVWDSLAKDKEVYSFISKGHRMLCINPELNFHDIENLLLEFFIFDMKESDNDYILDDDFKTRYSNELKNYKLNILL